MTLLKIFIFSLLSFGFFFSFPFQTNAQVNVCTQPLVPCGHPVCCTRDTDGDGVLDYPPGCTNVDCKEPCNFCHIFILLNNLVQFLLICLVPPLALIFLVIGSLFLMVGGGSPALISRAKGILKSVLIGLFVTYAAWILVSSFLLAIGVEEWTGLTTWFRLTINCGGGVPGGGGGGGGTPPPSCDGLCNNICSPGCSVAEDPDCGCQNDDGCCGIGCDTFSDNDCPPSLPPPP